MTQILAIALALIIAGPLPAAAEALDAINWTRVHTCPGKSPAPLHRSAALQRAAQGLASGKSLRNALESARYLASESSALHLSGALDDAQISRALVAHDCSTLTNPRLTEAGIERAGSDIWMLLAAPVRLPNAADGAAIPGLILDLVNQARAAGYRCGAKYFASVEPLTVNAALGRAALAHSQDMAELGAFAHRGQDGSTPQSRVQRAGYGKYRIVGENIAAGTMTAREVTQGWLNSPPHCQNIMDGRFTQTGIAFAANPSSPEGMYWTQEFAAPVRADP